MNHPEDQQDDLPTSSLDDETGETTLPSSWFILPFAAIGALAILFLIALPFFLKT